VRSLLTYEIIKVIVMFVIFSFLLLLMGYMRAVYVKAYLTLEDISLMMQIGKRALTYAYYTGNLSETRDTPPIPRTPLAYKWDGFTLFGERVSTAYRMYKAGNYAPYPLASYIQQEGYTYKEAVWRTSAVLVLRTYCGGREIWVSVKR